MSGAELDIIEPDVVEAVEFVTAAWRQGVESIIETGRRLIEIRDRWHNQPGKWSRLIGQNQWAGKSLLPFQKSHVSRLVAIAERYQERLSPHVGILPSDTYTLYELTRLSDFDFQRFLTEGRINPAMKRSDLGAAIQREERLNNLAEISRGNAELSTAVRYPIIYADPPWRYENPPIGASNRSIENHYPTMTLEEICALPVSELATDDALLYLWATSPKLYECMKVIDAWGFQYRTDLVWDKGVIGMGYHARNQHETLLIAKRGEIPPPPAGTQPASVYRERRGKHSAKPLFYYEMIEAAYPQLPKIELFSRSPREGWAAWGNQAEAA